MFRYLGYVLIVVIAVALAGSVAAVLVGGVAECLAGRPAVSLSVFDAVGPAGGHPPRLRAVIEGPGGPRPLEPYWLLARFQGGWSGWAWVNRDGLARWTGPADLPPGPHRFQIGMPEVHPRLDILASATAWIWPAETAVVWIDAAAVAPADAVPGREGKMAAALKGLAGNRRCVYLVAGAAKEYVAARRRLAARGAPEGPAFWVIPGQAYGRLKGLKDVWPRVQGAVVVSADLAEAVQRLEVPLERVSAASEGAGAAAIRAAWRRARERFEAQSQADSSNGR